MNAIAAGIRRLFGPSGWFVVAVAASAAACGNILVEALSNHGLFGTGRFTDGSNADVGPVVLFGLALLARFAYLRVGERVRRGDRALVTSPVLFTRLMPAILAAQFGLLWLMETVEQFVVFGHGFGTWTWLGGPAVPSVALHVAIGVVITFALHALLCACEPRAARLIRALFARLAVAAASPPPAQLAGAIPLPFTVAFVPPLLRGRAPPSTFRPAI